MYEDLLFFFLLLLSVVMIVISSVFCVAFSMGVINVDDMLSYSLAVLRGIANMLQTEPFLYLLGFIVLAITVKVFISLAKFK